MEALVLSIGSCSGSNVDKFATLPIRSCAVGGLDEHEGKDDKNKKQKLSKQELNRKMINEAKQQCFAIEGCVAQILCKLDCLHEDEGHYILRCTQLSAWCNEHYWDGRNFISRRPDLPSYLTFLGSQTFGYVSSTMDNSQ